MAVPKLTGCLIGRRMTHSLGPRYALLRPEFWNVPPDLRDTVQNILVTLA